MGTRKSASVSPRSAAVVRSSLGMAIVIGTPVEGHDLRDHAAESSIGSLEVDGPHDRELAGDTRRIRRRKHRDADPEDDDKDERKPRDPGSKIHATAREDDHRGPDSEAEHDAEDRARETQHTGLHDNRAPHLAARHAGGAEDPDLA